MIHLIRRLVLCALVIGLAPALHAERFVNRIVAIVNGDVITQTELEQAMAMLAPQLGRMPRAAATSTYATVRKAALEHLIDERLIKQAMQKAPPQMSDAAVNEAFAAFLREKKLTEAQLRAALAQHGMSMDAFRQRMTTQMAQSQFLQEEVGRKIVPSDAELHHYYTRHQPSTPATRKIRLAEIFLPAATAKSAAKISQHARTGNFAALAKKYSGNPQAAQGGELGLIDPATLDPKIAAAIAPLQNGDVSEPVHSARGWHIFKVLDRGETQDHHFARIKPQLQQSLFSEKMQQALEQYVAELRGHAYIETKGE